MAGEGAGGAAARTAGLAPAQPRRNTGEEEWAFGDDGGASEYTEDTASAGAGATIGKVTPVHPLGRAPFTKESSSSASPGGVQQSTRLMDQPRFLAGRGVGEPTMGAVGREAGTTASPGKQQAEAAASLHF